MTEFTHFGFTSVEADKKADLVARVFHSVAYRYDVMNDIMTLGLHRLWKRAAIKLTEAKRGDAVLDVASGTGDIAIRLARKVGVDGKVVLSDINDSMLSAAKRKIEKHGVAGNFAFVEADAEALPFADNSFDVVTMSFGLRNVTDQERTFESIKRVLKPGGRIVILEFSHPVSAPVKPLYDAYSFAVLPLMGKLILNDAASYRYLAESIRMHPHRSLLLEKMDAAGYAKTAHIKKLFGIVAIHYGIKP